MTAPAGRDAFGALMTGVEHPSWCNPTWCTHLTNDERPIVSHSARPQQWRVEDSWVRLELREVDEPGEPDQGPVLDLSIRGEDSAILSIPQATDLIGRMQTLVDLATREGQRTI